MRKKRRILCVDRIENGVAAAYDKDGERIDINCGEDTFLAGDIIYFDGEKYIKDERMTAERRKRLSALRHSLSDDKEG